MSHTKGDDWEAVLTVTAADKVADNVVVLTLAHPDGAELPAWQPGAHIDIVIDDDMIRQYSLAGDPADRMSYRVGVLLEPESRGGSKYLHEQVGVGSTLTIRGPRNHFEFDPSPEYLFIAGGIGITPMLPMIAKAEAEGADWQLVYGGRSRSAMAFLAELDTYGEHVMLLPHDEVERSLSKQIGTLLGSPQERTLVYCCGPDALLDSVEAACASWPHGALHLERFHAQEIDTSNDVPFEVVLDRSGITITVPAGRSIFNACEDAGVAVMGSCHEGTCGTCETVIIEGEADHRDSVLNADEKAANETMMVCVSRAKGDRLVIDL